MEQNNLLLLALKQIFELSAIPCNKYRFVSAELGFVRSMRGVLEISEQIFAFFFQAEDGIRDVAVTGVQTCALPI